MILLKPKSISNTGDTFSSILNKPGHTSGNTKHIGKSYADYNYWPARHRDAAGGLMFYRCYFFDVVLSFDNGWTDRNADCCVNTVDEQVTAATNLVHFGPVAYPLRSCGWRISEHHRQSRSENGTVSERREIGIYCGLLIGCGFSIGYRHE